MKKFKLVPISDDNNKRYMSTPKSDFVQWCFLNGDKFSEFANEGDYELFDKAWKDMRKIFGLDRAGYPI